MPFTIRPFRRLLLLVFHLSVCALISLLPLSTSPVYAEWVALEDKYQTPGLQTLYIDPNTIRRKENLVSLEMVVDWNWMQGNRSPTRFYSTKSTKEFDCAGKSSRSVASIDFYGHMGTGHPVGGGIFTNETYWAPIEPESLNDGLWTMACGNP